MKFGQEIVGNCGIMRRMEEHGAPPGSGVVAVDVVRCDVRVIFRDDEVFELEYQPGAIFQKSGVGLGLG